MKDDLWACFIKCGRDLVLVCDIYIVILDTDYSIVPGLDIEHGDSRHRLQLEKLLDGIMTKRATAPNHEGRFDLGHTTRHDGW